MSASLGPWKSMADILRAIDQPTEPTTGTRTLGLDQAWPPEIPSTKTWSCTELTGTIGSIRIPPAEIPDTLPQHLLALQVAHEAWKRSFPEDKASTIDRTRFGTWFGVAFDPSTTHHMAAWQLERLASDLEAEEASQNNTPYGPPGQEHIQAIAQATFEPLTAPRVMGALSSIVASRVAREFQLGGPSYVLSSGDHSSMDALECAVNAILDGELEGAIVGSVDFAADPRRILARKALLPHTNLAPADGAAAVVLVREDLAVQLNLPILAWLDQSSRNSLPDKPALEQLYQIEAGDRIQATKVLEQVVEQMELPHHAPLSDPTPSPVISLSQSLGQAGVASPLIALVLQTALLQRPVLPPSKNFGPLPAKAQGRFYAVPSPQYWYRDQAAGPRKATLLVAPELGLPQLRTIQIEEPQLPGFALQRQGSLQHLQDAGLLLLRESSWDADRQLLLRLLQSNPEARARTIAQWFFEQRVPDRGETLSPTPIAAAVVLTEDPAQRRKLIESLQDPAASAILQVPRVFARPTNFPAGKLAFVFPGSGSHYLGMGLELGAKFPRLLDKIDTENQRLASQMAVTRFAPLLANHSESAYTAAHSKAESQLEPIIFAHVSHGVFLAQLLQQLGVKPQASLGYSLGESTGYFSFGFWRDRDEMYGRMIQSDLFSRWLGGECEAAKKVWNLEPSQQADWLTALIPRPVEAVRKALADHPRAYLLIINTPTECVIGGWRPSVEAVARELGAGLIALPGVPTVHCPVAEVSRDAYHDLHVFRVYPNPDVTVYSVAHGAPLEVTSESAAESITLDALYGFDFPAVIERMLKEGITTFVEVGPKAWTSRMIQKIAGDRAQVLAIESDLERPFTSLLQVLGQLALLGHWNKLEWLYGPNAASLTYPDPSTTPALRLPSSTWTVSVEPTRQKLQWPRKPLPRLTSAHHRQQSSPQPLLSQEPLPLNQTPIQPDIPVAPPTPVPPQINPNTPEHSCFDPLLSSFAQARITEMQAHQLFLEYSQQAYQAVAALAERIPAPSVPPAPPAHTYSSPAHAAPAFIPPNVSTSPLPAFSRPGFTPEPSAPALTSLQSHEVPWLDREQCLEFARGKISAVLGPEFLEVDTFPTRVRLPDEPLMLCDRIMAVEGTKGQLGPGRVITEHDVLPGKWYLDQGRMPVCIAVESGQADLFLSAYLGIDLQTRGLRVYRLLDAEITFHRHLPVAGEVIRYDIHIDRFVQSGETWLFFFRFEGTIGGQPLLTMRNGCAGFFTYEEIAASGGIVVTPEERAALDQRSGKRAFPELPIVCSVASALTELEVDRLREGDLSPLGTAFARLPIRNPATIPGGIMRLVHRVTSLEPLGGRHQLGFIRAEADIHPQDWFLTCHFVDDRVMPGTLMYECCSHTLRILLLGKGWVCEAGSVAYDPIIGQPAKLRCRGPVTEKTKVVTYELTITEIGLAPEPFVLAEALMLADGFPIVRFTGMSLRLTGVSLSQIQQLWQQIPGTPPHLNSESTPDGIPSHSSTGSVQPLGGWPVPLRPQKPLYTNEQIVAFAEGNPSEAFGEPYRIFDSQRRIARLPRAPYKFLDRITRIEGYEPFVLAAPSGAWIESQYDVPHEEWYFPASGQGTMPFAVLLEIALQPCGWLAAYLGSALRSPIDLRFRNLGGTARLHKPVMPEAGLLTVRVAMTKISEAGGMIIQDFAMQVWQRDEIIYEGVTNFGFFTAEALANQLGIRDASQRRWSEAETSRLPQEVILPKKQPITPQDQPVRTAPNPASHLSLPAASWLMLDIITHRSRVGGRFGQGHLIGRKKVRPEEWFFAAHFYQDPVCPGSLGLESFLQLLQWELLQRCEEEGLSTQGLIFLPIAQGADRPHSWIYRGQVVPANSWVDIEASISAWIPGPEPRIQASGFLLVDGLPIYEIIDFEVVATRPSSSK
jgi:PfaB family protein